MKQARKKYSAENISQNKVNKKGWLINHPVSFFLISISILIVAFILLLQTAFFEKIIFEKLISINATLCSNILNLFGRETRSFQGDIISPSISVSVRHGCDALEPMALFAAAVISFPSSIKSKLKGIFWGLTFLFILNLLRIVSLFLIKQFKPEWFDFFHVTVLQVVFIITAMGCFIFWIKGVQKYYAFDVSK